LLNRPENRRCVYHPYRDDGLYIILAACYPLRASEWEQVPTPCYGLGSALPDVLARSEVEAAHLVAHLTDEDKACLRTFALCLARCQRSLSMPIPATLVRHMLSLFDSDDACSPMCTPFFVLCHTHGILHV